MASGTNWQALGRHSAINSALAIVEPSRAPFASQNAVSSGGFAGAAGDRLEGGEGWEGSCAACSSEIALGASGSDDEAVNTVPDSLAEGLPELRAEGASCLSKLAAMGEDAWAAEICAAATLVPHIASVTSHKPVFADSSFIGGIPILIFCSNLRPRGPCRCVRTIPIRQPQRALPRFFESCPR